MELEFQVTKKVPVAFIEVAADVRYWEDASVEGVADVNGDIPLREGDTWKPVINLATGEVKGWPQGVTADVHYKVCDEGEYWLQDESGQRVAKWKGCYVPDILSVGDNGYGDYIILKIAEDAKIIGWRPSIDAADWECLLTA
jgi:hypothetical protein